MFNGYIVGCYARVEDTGNSLLDIQTLPAL